MVYGVLNHNFHSYLGLSLTHFQVSRSHFRQLSWSSFSVCREAVKGFEQIFRAKSGATPRRFQPKPGAPVKVVVSHHGDMMGLNKKVRYLQIIDI